MNDAGFRRLACRPWDGFWTPFKGDGFLQIHQHTASAILRSGMLLSQWEGQFLDAIHNAPGVLSPAQDYWLCRLTDRYEAEVLGVAA